MEKNQRVGWTRAEVVETEEFSMEVVWTFVELFCSFSGLRP